MAHTRCNYCGQVVQFIDIRGNNTCPVCRQSSTSCCEGGSCTISYSEQEQDLQIQRGNQEPYTKEEAAPLVL